MNENVQPAESETRKILKDSSVSSVLNIPKLLPPCQNYSRSKDGTVGREEWLSINEVNISDMWEGLRSYLTHCNSHLLDRCTYVDFSDFVARYSTHFSD